MMGDSRTLEQVLLIFMIVCSSSPASAVSNTTQVPGSLTTGQSHGVQETCQQVTLQNSSYSISAAVNFLTAEQNLQQIMPLFQGTSQFQEMLQNVTSCINCTNYQNILTMMATVFDTIPAERLQGITNVLLSYLKKSASDINQPVCRLANQTDAEWIQTNLGQFSLFLTSSDLMFFNLSLETLVESFSPEQKADFLLESNNLSNETLVILVFSTIKASPSPLENLQSFFATFVNGIVKLNSTSVTSGVRDTILNLTLAALGPNLPLLNADQVKFWFQVYLPFFLPSVDSRTLEVIFGNVSCSSYQEIVKGFDQVISQLSEGQTQQVFTFILDYLSGQLSSGPTPLKCYSGGSFYVFLKNSFLSFGFPDVSRLLSLLPPTRTSELLNTFNTSELHQFLTQPGVISNSSDVCVIFSYYNNTEVFLETEDIPDDVKRVILPCVWKTALSSSGKSDVNFWFDVGLKNYFQFLTKSLISSTEVQNASCLAFQKLVFVMGNNFTYNGSEIGQGDVYNTIRSYLSAGSGARCYNSSDPELNSTAWFYNNIGNFVTHITLTDLTSFVSTSQIQVFLENQFNLNLFNNIAIAVDVTNFYISQLFTFNPTFSPIKLPGLLLCSSKVPILPFSFLDENDTLGILDTFGLFCNGSQNPEISSTLASNIKTITLDVFNKLGSACSGLTISQILSVSSSVLISALSTLSSVVTWAEDQAEAILNDILSSGFQINSAAALKSLGSLISGLLSDALSELGSSDILSLTTDIKFIVNLVAAPEILQLSFVTKIISFFPNFADLIQHIPDVLASEIPSILLVFTQRLEISLINQKAWTLEQSIILFRNLGATNTSDIEQLSSFVLQGFTCTSVQVMTPDRILQLIHASRPRTGRNKVQLKEPQLTCMFNLIRDQLSQTFTDYPSDMLLYFNSQNVLKENCRSYFTALGAADFTVASVILNKGQQLFSQAKTCLGISGFSLSRDTVGVLGNMACTLDGSYIQNSDPLILENLKACNDFSDSQVAAMETLLLSGTTQYGNVPTWTQQTLQGLGILPLYLTRNIWSNVITTEKMAFLKTFMPSLRQLKTEKFKLKNLFKQFIPSVSKRGAGCNNGNISPVTISNPAFPIGYDQTQFNLCLDVPVLKDNLYSICEKVDNDAFQMIILKKLNQAFTSGVPDQQVQMLGSVSRVATLDDISKWSITKIDTLAALMKTEDGTWDPAKSKAIITKYLNTLGNSLGSAELSIIGSNVCSLDPSSLSTITADSIKNAKSLNVTSCSAEQKKILYGISYSSFSSHDPIDFYNLIKPYLGGAPLADVVALSTNNINMDVNIFRSLLLSVITNLTVTNVQGLMGNQLRDLKLFENDPTVQTWVNLQLQSDLDKLGIGLISNRTDPTTGAPAQASSGGTEFLKQPTFLSVLLTAVLLLLQRPA